MVDDQANSEMRDDSSPYQYYEEPDCYDCLKRYDNAYFCSSAVSGEKDWPNIQHPYGWCCVDEVAEMIKEGDDKYPHLRKPQQCNTIPEMNYKCSSDLKLPRDRMHELVPDNFQKEFMRWSYCLSEP